MQARCPNCEAVVVIPHTSPFIPDSAGEQETLLKEAIAISVTPYRDKVLEYQSNLKKITEEYNSNIAELRESERTALSLQKELWELESEVHELQGGKGGPPSGNDDKVASEALDKLQAELDELKATHEEVKGTQAELEQQKEAAEKSLAEKEQALADQEKELKALASAQEGAAKTQADLDDANKFIKELQAEAKQVGNDHTKAIKELEKSLKDNQKASDKLQTELDRAIQKAEQAEKLTKEAQQSKKDDLASLRAQFIREQNALQESLELIEKKADERQQRINELDKSLQEASASQEGSAKVQEQEAERRQELEKELDSLRDEKLAADQRIATLDEENTTRQTAIQSAVGELEISLVNLQQSVSGFSEREAHYARALDSMAALIADTQQSITQLNEGRGQKVNELEEQLKQQQEAMDDLTQSRDSFKNEYDEALARMQDQEIDLQSTKHQVELLQQEADNARALNEKLDQIEYHAAENASRNESYRKLIMELEDQNKVLNEQLRDREAIKAEVEKLRTELKKAKEAPTEAEAPAKTSTADSGQDTLSGRGLKQMEVKMRQLTRENERLKNNINTLRENLRAIMTSKH